MIEKVQKPNDSVFSKEYLITVLSMENYVLMDIYSTFYVPNAQFVQTLLLINNFIN
jgi:hypothetical protein